MTSMFLDTPMDWDAMAELPQKDGSVPPEAKSSEDKQGHGTYISPSSYHIVSMEGPTISESGLL